MAKVRILLALRCFWRVLTDPTVADRVREWLDEKKVPGLTEKAAEEKLSTEAVQLLALMQREGRFVDFLQEEIAAFDNAQIGAAVRSVHEGCRRTLEQYFEIEPVLSDGEGSQVTVPEGFEPSRIQLLGEVRGDPPFEGVLKHHGWRASRAHLPTLPEGWDIQTIAPAEVEIE